jgi:hypothetical protein
MEQHYSNLNKKLDNILNTKPRNNNRTYQTDGQHRFHDRIRNLADIELSQEEQKLLSLGMNYSTERAPHPYAIMLAAETEQAFRHLDNKIQDAYRHLAAKKLKHTLTTNNHKNTLHKRLSYIMKNLRYKLTRNNATLTKADKGKTIVIIKTAKYTEKVNKFISDNEHQTLITDPTPKYQKLV